MTSDFQQLLEELYSLQRLGIKTGLEHTEQLLSACGNPHNNLKFVHIAGTNGKGSTAAILNSILRTAGMHVGLYTSPHLLRFNERIRVSGIPIADEQIVHFMDTYLEDINRIQSTFFETTTALAFWYFSKQEVDIAIIETGLGGRLDATNVITPDCAVITSISLDHQDILGPDIKKISQEKAGIIKANVPVLSATQNAAVQNVIYTQAAQMGAPLQLVADPVNINLSTVGTIFDWNNDRYQVSLIGPHQATNAALAITAAHLVQTNINPKIIKNSLLNVTWPGRMQVLADDPLIIYDVAHNTSGIESILRSLNMLNPLKPLGVVALKRDKKIQAIAATIKEKFTALWVMTDTQGYLLSTIELSARLLEYDIATKSINDTQNISTLHNNKHPQIIFGSHHIADTIFTEFHFPFDKGII